MPLAAERFARALFGPDDLLFAGLGALSVQRVNSVGRTTHWHLEVKDEPDRRAARATNWSG